jgi:hypothetical protein
MISTQERAQNLAPRLDGDFLKRTLDLLKSDDDLEQFFEAIPGFCVSKIVDDPRHSLDTLGKERLAEALVEFWNRTLSSNRVSESRRRIIVCIKVIEAADLSIAIPQILHLFSMNVSGVTRSVETGNSLAILRNGNAASLVQSIIASIISANDERDERWFTFTKGELGKSEDDLQRYLTTDHGDSVLLANLIHITRHFFDSLHLDFTRSSLSILPSLSKFDILNTLPELQHEFCALWNEIVQQAWSSEGDDNPFIDILVEIRGLYVALHGTDAAVGYFFASINSDDDHLYRRPASYPLCTMPDHECNLTAHIQEASGSTTGGSSHSTTTTSPTPFSESSLGNVIGVPPHVPTPEPSHSTPSGRHSLPIDSPPATGTVQCIADTSLTSSMAHPIARSPSITGDAPRHNEIPVSSTVFDSAVIRSDSIRQGLESPPSASTNTLSHPNPQAITIAEPNNTGRTSSVTLRANDNAQDLDPAIQTKLTRRSG